jgi:hypothetical protein
MTTLELTDSMRMTQRQLKAAPERSLVFSADPDIAKALVGDRKDLAIYPLDVLDDEKKRGGLGVRYGAIVIDHVGELTLAQADQLLKMSQLMGVQVHNTVPAEPNFASLPVQLLADVIPWGVGGTGLIIRDKNGKQLATLKVMHRSTPDATAARRETMDLMEDLSRRIEGRNEPAPVQDRHKV